MLKTFKISKNPLSLNKKYNPADKNTLKTIKHRKIMDFSQKLSKFIENSWKRGKFMEISQKTWKMPI